MLLTPFLTARYPCLISGLVSNPVVLILFIKTFFLLTSRYIYKKIFYKKKLTELDILGESDVIKQRHCIPKSATLNALDFSMFLKKQTVC